MKYLLSLPSLAFLIIALFNFFVNNYLGAALWFLTAVIFMIIFFPIIINLPEKKTPVFQIFIALFSLLFFFSAAAISDLYKAGFSQGKAAVLGCLIGVATLGIIMLVRKKES